MNFSGKQIVIKLILIFSVIDISITFPAIFQRNIDDLINEFRSGPKDPVLFWNYVTLQACANDYDTVIANVPDQPGPTATSRAFAIVHGAMYDSINTLNRASKPVLAPTIIGRTAQAYRDLAMEAAIMESAYQTLYVLYPKQRPIFEEVRNNQYKILERNTTALDGIRQGVTTGQLIASHILDTRKNDRSGNRISYTPINEAGYHQPDPIHVNQGFLDPHWGNVKPFLLDYGSQFRASNIIGDTPITRRIYLNSMRYLNDLNEVRSFGARVSTNRTSDQTEIGNFWAYDGVPKLGVPPRLYNQIVRVVAIQQNNTKEDNARLFALVNYAMADAGIAAWESKYFYNFWRPIVGIRQRSATSAADRNWQPLGAPTNGAGNNFTPGFPSYVSGHATFGSAVFQILRLFYGTDDMPFEFQSDEYNGKTVDSITRRIRPIKKRRYNTFTEAETENLLSRIYLGVHWRIDQEEGQKMGQNVASFVYNQLN